MTVKDLAAYIAALPEEERILQFGKKAADPLQGAFRHKRVVHAGLKGRMIPPDKAQARWNALMERPVEGNPLQMAYLHIPFCKTKCLYCGFFQNGTDMSVEDRYVDHLLMELAQDADKPRLQSAPIQSVFIGGGTPTSLSPSNIRRLVRAIRKTLPLANDYELTLEGRVHDLVEEKMDVWMEEGVNRISLGVQSFDTKVRQQVGRIDTGEEVMKRLQKLSAYNQCAVIIDLMYGLPDQTLDVWQEDLHHLVESGVDGADLYQLDVFENSDLHKRIEEGRLSPAATTLMQTEMFRIGRRYMAQWGCKRISHCHWAKNNRERSLYNTLARSGTHLFPFGCGAGGHVDGVSTMLHRVLGPYEGMVARGVKPFMFLSEVSPFAAYEARVQGEMNQCHLNLDALMALDPRLVSLSHLGDLWEEYGLWHFNGIQYDLTEAGEFWVVNMTQTLLECIQWLLGGEKIMNHAPVAAQG